MINEEEAHMEQYDLILGFWFVDAWDLPRADGTGPWFSDMWKTVETLNRD